MFHFLDYLRTLPTAEKRTIAIIASAVITLSCAFIWYANRHVQTDEPVSQAVVTSNSAGPIASVAGVISGAFEGIFRDLAGLSIFFSGDIAGTTTSQQIAPGKNPTDTFLHR